MSLLAAPFRILLALCVTFATPGAVCAQSAGGAAAMNCGAGATTERPVVAAHEDAGCCAGDASDPVRTGRTDPRPASSESDSCCCDHRRSGDEPPARPAASPHPTADALSPDFRRPCFTITEATGDRLPSPHQLAPQAAAMTLLSLGTLLTT